MAPIPDQPRVRIAVFFTTFIPSSVPFWFASGISLWFASGFAFWLAPIVQTSIWRLIAPPVVITSSAVSFEQKSPSGQ